MLYGYDLESYPNVFTITFQRRSDKAIWRFEISFRRNQGVELFDFLTQLRNSGGEMVGYNNVGYDYPVLHELICKGGHIEAFELYQKTDSIINGDYEDRFDHVVWESDWHVPQIDLFKIHHFDNNARYTSLKMLEFNMRSKNIQDLPFTPGTDLTSEQIDQLIPYNDHDVFETMEFLEHTMPMIEFRREWSAKHDKNVINYNDGKIGSDYFITELERLGIPCYEWSSGEKLPRQSIRNSIALNECILPWISFQNPEFQRVHGWLSAQTITETKGVFKNLDCTVNGFKYVFGLGGIHGSIESTVVSSDDQYQLIDLDVKSYYPDLSIQNRFYPQHLGEQFCDIYEDIYKQRQNYAKGTIENAALKYALNVPYGQSNSKYSPFFDSKYTMSVTINGQLLLCLLAEYLAPIPGLSMIQINTDGLTVKLPHDQIDALMFVAQTWEELTGLTLERADYSRMMIRDVNGYIGEYTDGKLKNKGPYVHKTKLSEGTAWHPDSGMDWNQNHSCPIVAMAAEAALVRGVPIADTIRNHTDVMDFMMRTKVPRSSRLMLECPEPQDHPATQQQLQNITRYYVSTEGGSLIKIMPPTPKQVEKAASVMVRVMVKEGMPDGFSNDESSYWNYISDGYRYSHNQRGEAPERRIGVNVGWTVKPCNDLDATPLEGEWAMNRYFSDLNYDYYIKEAEKLVKPLIG